MAILSENIRMSISKDESAFLLYDNVRDNQNLNSDKSLSHQGGSQQHSQISEKNKNGNPQALYKFTTFYNSVRSTPLFEH